MPFWTDSMLMGVGGYGFLALVGAGPNQIQLYDQTTFLPFGQTITQPSGTANAVAISQDGSLMAVGTDTSPFLHTYRPSGLSKLSNPPVLPAGSVTALAFSKNGAYLAVGMSVSPYLRIYNTSDWTLLSTYAPASPPGIPIVAMDWSPDGTSLAIGASTLTNTPNYSVDAFVFDTSTWNRRTLSPPASGSVPVIRTVYPSFNPSGTRLAFSVSDETKPSQIVIYNTATWASVSIASPYNGGSGPSAGTQFAPNGSALFLGTFQGKIFRYDPTTFAAVDQTTEPTSAGTFPLSVSRDSVYVATTSGVNGGSTASSIPVYSTATMDLYRTINAVTARNALAFGVIN